MIKTLLTVCALAWPWLASAATHPADLPAAAASNAGVAAVTGVAAADPAHADPLVAQGAYLARLGDCFACHTAPKGRPFAGGLPMATPMGKIYATNITPDPETGIGQYTEQDFERALRQGVARDGHNLYPAMPYTSYAKVSDGDIKALYAYFMKGVAPIRQANRASEIPFPLNLRWPLSIWNAVFLDKAVYRVKDDKDVAWNRGAYLVQGLGHCSACHTPRGVAFQEKALDETGAAFLTGGVLDDWYASNLTGEPNVGLGRWTQAELASFLKTGANSHATAFGAMTDVINHSSQYMTNADLNAISAYLKALPAKPGTQATRYVYDPKASLALLQRPAGNPGAKVYAAYCMQCHAANGAGVAPLLAPLAGNPNLLDKDPSSLINVTLNGTRDLVIQGLPAAYPMPKFAAVLSDQQVADVVSFIRAGWNNGAAPVSAEAVAKLRKSTQASR